MTPCCSQRQASLAIAFGCRTHWLQDPRASGSLSPHWLRSGSAHFPPNLGTFWLQSSCWAIWGWGCLLHGRPSLSHPPASETSLPGHCCMLASPPRVCFRHSTQDTLPWLPMFANWALFGLNLTLFCYIN